MEFRKEGTGQREAQTLERVAQGIALVTAMAALLILPSAAFYLASQVFPNHLAAGQLAFVIGLVAPWGIYPLTRAAARRVLLAEPRAAPSPVQAARPARTWPQRLAWAAWMVVAFVVIFVFRSPLRAWMGDWVDVLFYGLVFAPTVLGALWRRRHSWRALLALSEVGFAIGAGVGGGALLAWYLVDWLATQHPMGGLALLPVTLILMPAGLGLVYFPVLTLQSRRALVPVGRGDFEHAILWARATPHVGDDMVAALQMEAGRFDEARATLEATTSPLAQLVEAVLLDEAGDAEAAWERMHAIWTEHQAPHDVLIVAQGLDQGADVGSMLETMDATRSRLEGLLVGQDFDPAFAACRAWVHAVQGDEAAAREALPDERPLLPLYQVERDYLIGRALHALGEPGFRAPLERAAAGCGRASRLAARFLAAQGAGAGSGTGAASTGAGEGRGRGAVR